MSKNRLIKRFSLTLAKKVECSNFVYKINDYDFTESQISYIIKYLNTHPSVRDYKPSDYAKDYLHHYMYDNMTEFYNNHKGSY